jgi:hypothetical protein
LGFGDSPFARGHSPFFFGSVQDEKQQFHCGFVGWKCPLARTARPSLEFNAFEAYISLRTSA